MTDYSKPEPLWLLVATVIAVALVIVLGVVAILWASDSRAAPRVPSQSACQYLADYALVARALAEDASISELQSDTALWRIYVQRDSVIEELQLLIRDHARSEQLRSAQRYAADFLQACVERQGQIDSFFGVAL